MSCEREHKCIRRCGVEPTWILLCHYPHCDDPTHGTKFCDTHKWRCDVMNGGVYIRLDEWQAFMREEGYVV